MVESRGQGRVEKCLGEGDGIGVSTGQGGGST